MPGRKQCERPHHVPMREQMSAVASRRDVGEIAGEHRIEVGIFFVTGSVEHAKRDALGVAVGEQLRNFRPGRVAVQGGTLDAERIEKHA